MSQELLDNTIIIRLADHGEMGMSHGGMRFKDLNAYQETMNVPLVISNPLLFPEGQCVDQLVGLVDIMPTLASIIGLSDAQKALFSFKGIDFSPVLLNAQSPTQPSMLYTYDDGVTADEIGYIRTLVKADYKFSVYYQTADGTPTGAIQPATFQYELYNLLNDASEMNNLLPVGGIERLQTPAEAIAIANLKLQLYNELTQKMLDTQTTPNGWPAPAIA
jgi:arylsulfatase A-like enzyme